MEAEHLVIGVLSGVLILAPESEHGARLAPPSTLLLTNPPDIGIARTRPNDCAAEAIAAKMWRLHPHLRGRVMVRIWSELPGARLKEQVADFATLLWLLFWGSLAWQLYQLLAGFAEAGRAVRGGGRTMIDAGANLGEALAGVPLIGEGLRDVTRNAFAGAGMPIADFGTAIEQFILLVAAVLALLLALVTLMPWLSRYVPWRWERLRRTRAAHRAIRRAPEISKPRIAEVLALRAVTRLDYETLLGYTPDPLGDWATGRHDRLAKAELASVGLRG